MSLPFELDGAKVWDPALGIGNMFIALAGAAAEVLGQQSGMAVRRDGTCEIDSTAFRPFVEALRKAYVSTNHPVHHQQIAGILLVSLELLDRGGVQLDASTEADNQILREARALGQKMVRP
jgi:hypothetical protein